LIEIDEEELLKEPNFRTKDVVPQLAALVHLTTSKVNDYQGTFASNRTKIISPITLNTKSHWKDMGDDIIIRNQVGRDGRTRRKNN